MRAPALSPGMHYGYANTAIGQLHYVEVVPAESHGLPLLLLHQTPRSGDEFREVLPILGRSRRVVAMNMYGFGMSSKPIGEQTIELYADGAIALLNSLGIEQFAVLGHHTGSYVAVELAARVPERVVAAVLSAGELADAEHRQRRAGGGPPDAPDEDSVDVATPDENGAHLTELWAKRLPFYPAGRIDLLDRFIRDALAPGVDPAAGHRACKQYHMESRLPAVVAPLLFLAATEDPFSFPGTRDFVAAFRNAASTRVIDIAGGRIPLMEQKADEVAAAVSEFLFVLERREHDDPATNPDDRQSASEK